MKSTLQYIFFIFLLVSRCICIPVMVRSSSWIWGPKKRLPPNLCWLLTWQKKGSKLVKFGLFGPVYILQTPIWGCRPVPLAHQPDNRRDMVQQCTYIPAGFVRAKPEGRKTAIGKLHTIDPPLKYVSLQPAWMLPSTMLEVFATLSSWCLSWCGSFSDNWHSWKIEQLLSST